MSSNLLKKVFVSGCYDILHAGHIYFFQQARSLGDHLTVCFASAEVLAITKHRKPSLPDDHKRVILSELSCVDAVVSSSDLDPVFDFRSHIDSLQPDILVVTEDDQNAERKKIFCEEHGIEFVILPKHFFVAPISTTSILTSIKKQ